MNFWSFFDAHWFLAWCALWTLWIIVPIAHYILLAMNRVLRTFKVISRGWPPAHLDADGDWRPRDEVKAL